MALATDTSHILIDGLDFSEDTIATVKSKMPPWFGPQQAVQFVFSGKIVPEDTTLADMGILLGGVIRVVSKPIVAEARADF